ncbi:MAG: methyltransferase domain-containing protein [Bacteroidetes bacterium]|nr:MAG: methyltransferase domain-containing protein [Bacteroidota bacterium]
MRRKLLNTYICPLHKTPLTLKRESVADQLYVYDGEVVSSNGMSYLIEDGIPNFIFTDQLSEVEEKTQTEYDYVAEEIYDNAVDWLFESFYENEDLVREKMIDLLDIDTGSRVLEVGCGTGRDSFRIAQRLGKEGIFFLQDLSRNMVVKTRKRLTDDYKKLGLSCELNYFVSSATYLPFPDGYFDALFHFGGFNNFSNPKQTLEEFSRVVRKGGKVVFGDESLPPWLEGTPFGEIVCTNNLLFRHKVPLWCLPANCREVTLRWILGSCFYLIDYRVGDGTPPLNLDLPHKGRRGGTMRTRYYGQLEGVTMEAKKLAQEAAAKRGISLHDWLDQLVRKGAEKDLGK